MAKKPYKWDQAKWEKDDEWWNPYNKVGRLKGKGSTTCRKHRPIALGKMAKGKKTEAMEVIQEETQQPLEKRKKTTDDPKEKGAASKKLEPKKAEKEAASGASASSSSGEHAKPLEKEAVKEKPEKPLEKDAAKEEPGKPLEKGKATEELAKPLEKRQAENEPQKKEESKPVETELAAHEPAKPLEKGQATWTRSRQALGNCQARACTRANRRRMASGHKQKKEKRKAGREKNLPGCGGERWVAGSQDPKAKAKNKQGVCEPGVRICQLL